MSAEPRGNSPGSLQEGVHELSVPKGSATEPSLPSRFWILIVSYVLVAVVGLIGGWIVAQQGGGGGGGHSQGGGHGHEGGSSGMDTAVGEFGPERLANLGVSTEIVAPRSHVVTRSLQASIIETPFSRRPLQAAWGGIVESIEVVPGQMVEPGEHLLTLIRDPMPRPELSMTESVLKPANEDVHDAVSNLLGAQKEIDISQSEIERVEKYVNEVVPRNRVVQLRYTLARAESQKERALEDLEKHGFSDAQIEAIVRGDSIPPLSAESWKRALRKNGLWPPSAEALYSSLPETTKARLWCVASVGELAARGLDSEQLVSWFETDPQATPHFLEIAALLQRGYSVRDTQRLQQQGVFDPVVVVRAPRAARVPDWDVGEILVSAGSRVEEGTPLLSLVNARSLYLVTEPVGSEEVDLLQLVTSGGSCWARSLVSGAGPRLENLSIDLLRGDPTHGGTLAFLTVSNEVIARPDSDSRRRTWALRPGLRYSLEVPQKTWEEVFVLPSGALTEVGGESVVLIPDGGSFRPLPVIVLYQDHEVVLLKSGHGSKLFPGDEVVVSGALALGLALGGSGQVDAHAGHSH